MGCFSAYHGCKEWLFELSCSYTEFILTTQTRLTILHWPLSTTATMLPLTGWFCLFACLFVFLIPFFLIFRCGWKSQEIIKFWKTQTSHLQTTSSILHIHWNRVSFLPDHSATQQYSNRLHRASYTKEEEQTQVQNL